MSDDDEWAFFGSLIEEASPKPESIKSMTQNRVLFIMPQLGLDLKAEAVTKFAKNI